MKGKLSKNIATTSLFLFLASCLFFLPDVSFAQSVSFSGATTFAVGSFPFSVALGDFNGDGNLDLAVAAYNDGTVSILLGNGDGTFQAVTKDTTFTVGDFPTSVAVADFDGDGKLDLAVAYAGDSSTKPPKPAGLSILLGNGDGTFQAAASFALGIWPYSVAVGDFNGDGKLDLAVADVYSNPANVFILLGTGTGSFGEPTPFPVGDTINPQINPTSLAVGDFNGDGKLDLAVANSGSNNVSILLGNGDGTFQAATTQTDYAGSQPNSVAAGDFNGDGKLDLAVTNWDSATVSVLLGNGDGTFQADTHFTVGVNPTSVALGDFNGDGNLDLAVANQHSNNVSVRVGDGTGSFPTSTNFAAGSGPTSVAVGVFNKDGKLDLAVTNGTNKKVSILLNTTTIAPPGTFQLAKTKLPDMEVGVSYDAPLITGGIRPYTFAATKGSFPAGLSGNPTNGHIAGTPTSSKAASFTVIITDFLGSSVTGAFKAAGHTAVNITTTSLKAATHGKSYNAKLKATGGKTPFQWSETSGNSILTTGGLTLDPSTGAITGKPTQIGTFNLTFQVNDGAGGVDQQPLTLTIN